MIDDKRLREYLFGKLDKHASAVIADRLRRDPTLRRRAVEIRRAEAAISEEMIDEALEMTFPASDPPFWMP